jgi:hypothetical protein
MNTCFGDIFLAFQERGFEVIDIKQKTVKRPSLEGSTTTVILPLFLVTLARCQKSQTIFTLRDLRSIDINV